MLAEKTTKTAVVVVTPFAMSPIAFGVPIPTIGALLSLWEVMSPLVLFVHRRRHAALLALGVLAAMNVIAGLIFRITP